VFAENLDVFLRDFGTVCVASSRIFLGLLDTPDETLSMGGVNVLSTNFLLTVKAPDAVGLATGSTIVVQGHAYAVRDVLQQDDGAFVQITLSY
jgi:hypothetical protein